MSMLCSIVVKIEPTSVCGYPKAVFRRVTCFGFRPRHNSAPSLLLPPAAVGLDTLWLTPHMRLFATQSRKF